MTANSQSRGTVAIVGGGLAGIAAALALAEAGVKVELFESRRRLGGRAGSFADEAGGGEEVDYCQHVGMACCTNLRNLIGRLGLEADWQEEATLHFYAADGRHLPLRASPLPAPLHMAGLLARWPGISWLDRGKIGHAILRLLRMRGDEAALEGQAVAWLRGPAGQSSRAIDHFWRTILVSALGERIERVALRPARKVILDGFAANRRGYRLLVPRRPLAAMFGDHAAQRLAEAGVTLRTGVGVESVRAAAGGGVELHMRSGESQCYAAAVLAVAWHRVDSILELAEVETAAEEHPRHLRGSPITGLHTWWDRQWLDGQHAILCDSMTQWVFAKPGGGAASSGETYYQIVISGSHRFSLRGREEIEAALKEDLRQIFPRIAAAQLLRARAVTDPRSVFSVAADSPPHRWAVDRFAARGIYLAGDWTDTGWPATMEGAVRSGYLAAAHIARTFNQPIPLPVADLPPGLLVRLIKRS